MEPKVFQGEERFVAEITRYRLTFFWQLIIPGTTSLIATESCIAFFFLANKTRPTKILLTQIHLKRKTIAPKHCAFSGSISRKDHSSSEGKR